jgi:serine/threonine protein kinase
VSVDPALLEPAVHAVYPGATVSCIDTGGFASTFRVDQTDGSVLAVKVLDPQKVTSTREEREILALQKVSDPRVVRYRAAATVNVSGQDFRYLAMDFVDGESLRRSFERGHEFSVNEIATLLEDVAGGAVAIWSAGLAHRDFNPGNVLVTPNGHAVIVDLGIARHMDLPTLTAVAPFAGMPGWMSPEQVGAQAERGDWRSDQFVIGLLLYRLVTGLEPYGAAQGIARWRAPADSPLLPVRYVAPGTPSAIASLIDRLTQMRPYDRFPQHREFTDAVGLAVLQARGQPIQAATATPGRLYFCVGNAKSHIDNVQILNEIVCDGLVVDATNVAPGSIQQWHSLAKVAGGVGVLDPINSLDQSPASARSAGYNKLPYSGRAQLRKAFADDAARRVYYEPITTYGRSSQAAVLIAPYFFSHPGDYVFLDESLRFGELVAQRSADDGWGREVWTGISIDASHLLPANLPRLLGEITRYSPSRLYVLVATSQATAAPLADAALLLGMRSLIERVNAYGGEIVFGRRATSGLLLLALGAAGWSTGYEGNTQNSSPPPSAPAGRKGRPADWYYVPGLLNSIKIGTRATLLAGNATLLAPTDRFAKELFASAPALADIGSNSAQRLLLHRHNFAVLSSQAHELASLSVAGRIAKMREWVHQAQASYSTIGAGALGGGEGGDFLKAWLQVL